MLGKTRDTRKLADNAACSSWPWLSPFLSPQHLAASGVYIIPTPRRERYRAPQPIGEADFVDAVNANVVLVGSDSKVKQRSIFRKSGFASSFMRLEPRVTCSRGRAVHR